MKHKAKLLFTIFSFILCFSFADNKNAYALQESETVYKIEFNENISPKTIQVKSNFSVKEDFTKEDYNSTQTTLWQITQEYDEQTELDNFVEETKVFFLTHSTAMAIIVGTIILVSVFTVIAVVYKNKNKEYEPEGSMFD